MSNIIEISSGQSVSIKGVSTSTSSIKVKEPSTSVSVTGVIASTSGDKSFTYTQGSSSATWNITHNLNKRPSVTVVDSAENVVIGEVRYINDNEVRLTFASGFSGKAYFN